jgi:hypothetical protein
VVYICIEKGLSPFGRRFNPKKCFWTGTVNSSLHFKSEVKLAVSCYFKSFMTKLATAKSTRVYCNKSLIVMYCISLTPIHLRVIEPPGDNPRVSVYYFLAKFKGYFQPFLSIFFNIHALNVLKFQVFILYFVSLFLLRFDFVNF